MKNKFRKIKVGLSVLVVFLLGYSMVHAQAPAPSQLSLAGVIDIIVTLFKDYVIKLIFSIAILYFMWGVTQYSFSEEESKKEKGKQLMLWGIISLTVMFSMYGLIRVAMNTFGINENETIKTPTLPDSQ